MTPEQMRLRLENEMEKVTVTKEDLLRLIEYVYCDEEADYHASDEPAGHIFETIQRLETEVMGHSLQIPHSKRGGDL